MSPLFQLRRARQEDVPFVISSWLTCDRRVGDNKHVTDDTYGTRIRNNVVRLIASSECIIATPINDPDTLLGFIVYAPPTVHYCYVKYSFRELGIATALLKESGYAPFASHCPKNEEINKKFSVRFVYDPTLKLPIQGITP